VAGFFALVISENVVIQQILALITS